MAHPAGGGAAVHPLLQLERHFEVLCTEFVSPEVLYALRQTWARAGERIRAGKSILAFPEGTRSRDGLILPFKKGPFVLAIEAQVPIIPVAIEGALQVLPRGGIWLRRHDIRVKVGQPIDTQGLGKADRDALLRQVRDPLIQLHREIGGRGGVPQAIAERGQEGRSPSPLSSLE